MIFSPPRKSYAFLQNFEKALLENLICSYGISFSWKILCVLTKFWTRSHGKFDLLLRYFLLLENRMCSCLQNFEKALLQILMCSYILPLLENLYMCSCNIFGSPGKLDVLVLIKELCLLLGNLRCSQGLLASGVADTKHVFSRCFAPDIFGGVLQEGFFM